MNRSLPDIQILPNQAPYNRPRPSPTHWYKSRRLLVFAIVFVLSLCISLGYVYSRPALFRSYATLLTVAQTAIDQQSSDADIQHVAIQRQILTGQELLQETLTRLRQDSQQKGNLPDTSNLSSSELRRMLTVQAVPDTNLVELAAIGNQAEILAPIINTWIDIYLERRAEQVRQSTGLTLETLREELNGLEDKILAKRRELEHFRTSNEITSLGRENLFENQSLARFKALNKAYNDASEQAVRSKARLDAVHRAIGQGKTVVPNDDKKGMRVLELRLQNLREQLAEFDKKYTREYLALNPSLNVLPGQIRDLEKEIQAKRNFGQSIALSDAQQDYQAAQQSLAVIKKQLNDHKQQASEFSTKFAEHESLLNDMQGLEKLQRVTQERIVQIEAKQAEKFPQVNIIERAFQPIKPFSPDYARDAMIAIVASIILGLLGVWTVEYLTRREGQNASISISGINLYADSNPELINNYADQNKQLNAQPPQPLMDKQNHALELDLPAELNIEQFDSLLEAADIKTKQLVALLLSGLSIKEIAEIDKSHFDFTEDTLIVTDEEPRKISLAPVISALFKLNEPCPTWKKNKPVTIEMLDAILIYAAADAGFSETQNINAETISHSYIVYLVKQGIRLSELEQVTGYIEPATLSKYSRYSPEKRALPISEINLFHPALSHILSDNP